MPSMETLLDAMRYSLVQCVNYQTLHYLDPYYPRAEVMKEKRLRQYNAFRERILRMDAEKDAKIALFNVCRGSYDALLKQQIELDQENQRLRELLRKMPEWVYDKDQECYFCEVCGSNKDYGHLKNCELAKESSDE